MTLIDIAEGLEKAERLGSDKDEPEGARYIQLSDTLARLFAEVLRQGVGQASGKTIFLERKDQSV